MNDIRITEEVDDLIVALSDAESAEQKCCTLAAFAVNRDDKLSTLIDLKLQPGTTSRDELRMMGEYPIIGLLGEIDARGTDKLRNNNALGAIDDKGTALSHEREIAHEDKLLFDLAGHLIDEFDIDQQRCLIGDVLRTTFIHRVSRISKLEIAEGDFHGICVVLDRRKLCE